MKTPITFKFNSVNCSNCGLRAYSVDPDKFCPSCGAILDVDYHEVVFPDDVEVSLRKKEDNLIMFGTVTVDDKIVAHTSSDIVSIEDLDINLSLDIIYDKIEELLNGYMLTEEAPEIKE